MIGMNVDTVGIFFIVLFFAVLNFFIATVDVEAGIPLDEFHDRLEVHEEMGDLYVQRCRDKGGHPVIGMYGTAACIPDEVVIHVSASLDEVEGKEQ